MISRQKSIQRILFSNKIVHWSLLKLVALDGHVAGGLGWNILR